MILNFVFRKRNGIGKTVRRRVEKRGREIHENRKIGHRFQIGKVGFQNKRLHQQTKCHRFACCLKKKIIISSKVLMILFKYYVVFYGIIN